MSKRRVKLTNAEIESSLRRKYGKEIGYIANVVNVSQPAARRKLIGLTLLAQEGRVGEVPFEYDWIRIDGEIVSISKLADYA